MRDVPLARRFRNLIGLPSCHYDGVYGAAVRDVIARDAPQAIALEVPPTLVPELAWAADCWPVPVASVGADVTVPFVAGDSIVEAFRAGRDAGLPIVPVDLDVADHAHGDGLPLPGAELAERVGPSFSEITSRLAAGQAPSNADLAREAAMAREVSALMRRFESVLWVGGLAHWQRLVERLANDDFDAPPVPCAPPRIFVRTRLAASALHRLTGQWPRLVARFATAPDQFDPVDARRQLLHEATRLPGPDVHDALGAPVLAEPPHGVIDVVRTALYARNFAASRGLREAASLTELLLAAKATIGDTYAAWVHQLAMRDAETDATRALPPLTWEVAAGRRRAGYRLKGRWLTTEAWWPADRGALALPQVVALDRAARDAHYEQLPGPGAGERFYWGAYPPDEAAYEEFVRYVLRRASVTDEDPGRSAPFTSGMRDGLDVRATIRHWHDNTLYVRDARRGAMRFTNGVIDWTSTNEQSPILWNQGAGEGGGWNDPDSARVGSCSREVQPHDVLMSAGGSQATLRHREWSLVTLDSPTFVNRARRTAFWNLVIERLVSVQGTSADNLPTWFETMCRFCAGKPLVYYSRYRPSPALFEMARVHRVRLVWTPLHRLPAPLLARHRTFRQLHLSSRQWTELRRRLGEGRSGVADFATVIA